MSSVFSQGQQASPSASNVSDKDRKTPPQKGNRTKVSEPVVRGKGKTWSMRRRVAGQDIFLAGYSSKGAVQAAMKLTVDEIKAGHIPVGMGAHKTCVAQALQDYAMARLPFLKGAPQEARRINVYLRAAGLALLKVTAVGTQEPTRRVKGKTGRGAFFTVELEACPHERAIPNGLHKHRRALANANARTDKLRAVLATTPMADVSRDQIQKLVDRMCVDANSASTVALERALLRVLFNYAFTVWKWPEFRDNPATKLKMPAIDNERSRVLSMEEQNLLDEALCLCRNEMVAPTLTLLRETAMRASEPLEHAVWADVDWERCVLKLSDGKAGSREVPLSRAALTALEQLRAGKACPPGDRIVLISYESMRAAWRRACERAGITDLRIHDLRHTAATRMALATGNVFLVKALTGHKTLSSLKRYINVNAQDVVEFMHRAPDEPACSVHQPAQDVLASGVSVPGKPSDSPAGTEQHPDSGEGADPLQVVGNVVYPRFRRVA